MTRVREFATRWDRPDPDDWAWFERDKERLVGSASGSDRETPTFRPFDMLVEPQQSLLVWENPDMQIGVESGVGEGPYFRRNCDYDQLIFQFAGQTTLETECGVFQLAPGELLLIPGGIAHRGNGTSDCLRLFAFLQEPVEVLYGEDHYTSHRELGLARLSPEHLRRWQHYRRKVDALGLHASVEQRPRAVVVPAGERERQLAYAER